MSPHLFRFSQPCFFFPPPKRKHKNGTSLSKHSSNDNVAEAAVAAAGAGSAGPTPCGGSQLDSQRWRQRRFWAFKTPCKASSLRLMADMGCAWYIPIPMKNESYRSKLKKLARGRGGGPPLDSHYIQNITPVLIGKGLLLKGWIPKIEDKEVPGIYT